MQPLNINFNTLAPSEAQKGQVEKGFLDIFYLSPSNSKVALNFTESKDGFSATINIVSESKNFEATTHGPVMVNVMESLTKLIISQLVEWKSHRYDDV